MLCCLPCISMVNIKGILSQFSCVYFRYYAIIVVIGGDNTSSTDVEDIGPYDEEEAVRASNNCQPYTYIAGIVETSDISDYPYPYVVGDESRSSIGGVDYENVQLQTNTTYAIMVRARTTDDLVSERVHAAGIYIHTCLFVTCYCHFNKLNSSLSSFMQVYIR